MLLLHLIALCAVLDTALTLYALSIGLAELNPLLRWLISQIGPWMACILTRAGFVVLVYWLGPGADERALWVVLAGAAGIVIHNIYVIVKNRP